MADGVSPGIKCNNSHSLATSGTAVDDNEEKVEKKKNRDNIIESVSWTK